MSGIAEAHAEKALKNITASLHQTFAPNDAMRVARVAHVRWQAIIVEACNNTLLEYMEIRQRCSIPHCDGKGFVRKPGERVTSCPECRPKAERMKAFRWRTPGSFFDESFITVDEAQTYGADRADRDARLGRWAETHAGKSFVLADLSVNPELIDKLQAVYEDAGVIFGPVYPKPPPPKHTCGRCDLEKPHVCRYRSE